MSESTTDFLIGEFERQHSSGFLLPREAFWVVTARTPSGAHLVFSRYDHERAWFCDASYASNGSPFFAHGPGGRGCAKREASVALADAINAAFLRQASIAMREVGGV